MYLFAEVIKESTYMGGLYIRIENKSSTVVFERSIQTPYSGSGLY